MKNKEFLANTKVLDNVATYGTNEKMKKWCKVRGGGGLYTC